MKKNVKQILQNILLKRHQPIVIGSVGRAGSTMLFENTVESCIRAYYGPRFSRFLNRVIADEAWDLTRPLSDGCIYKTHDYPSALNGRNVKVIYLFAKPSDSAFSAWCKGRSAGRQWQEAHMRHLGAEGDFLDIPRKDVLALGRHIQAWAAPQCFPVLRIRYEYIWEYEKYLSEFYGFHLQLPAQRERQSTFSKDAEHLAVFRQTYAEADSFVDSLPDLF